MDYVVLYNDRANPVEWASRREAEGWSGLAVGDHVSSGRAGAWHPFSALGAMAAVTERVTLTTAYANNLMRSPVECAQAALSLHALSAGRFQVGLGAGWAKDEIVASGLEYPTSRERAVRFREAVVIVRDLLRGPCRYDGEHYKIDLAAAGPPAAAPPVLAAALGGPWTIKHIAPLLDRIEINPAGAAIRGGSLDFEILGATMPDDVRSLIDLARQSNPDAKIGLSVFVAVGEGPSIDAIKSGFGDGFSAGLAGSPEQVAERVAALGDYGVDHVTLVPLVSGSADLLAPVLLT
jgi:alkanesulfonate monooxygenase SsuD/methylene tetrahydromethanopterin reductase-like flavin-dependent oxidoreductase (luciferase family)